MDAILHFDAAIFTWFRETLFSPAMDTFMTVVTHLGDGVIWIALGVIFLIFKKTRKMGVAVLLSLAVCAVFNNLIIKEIIARPRPFNLELDWWKEVYKYPELIKRPTGWSFPSGHTSTSLASAAAIFIYNKKIGIPAVLYALLVGISRIYLHVHYSTDVIAGVICGIIYAVITCYVLKKWVFPLIEKKMPKLGKILS